MSSPSAVQRPIDPAAVAELRRTVRGRVAYPADPSYAVAGRARPVAVVLAADEADAGAAVRVARQHGLGVGAADGALHVDVGRLTDVRIDPGSATATVGPGARWRDVVAAAAVHGLGPVPSCGPDDRVGPTVLGGAVGPFARTLGLCSDHVRALRVVGDDGVARPAGDELAYGLLGGAAPGIVTGLVLALVGPTTLRATTEQLSGAAVEPALADWLAGSAALPDGVGAAARIDPVGSRLTLSAWSSAGPGAAGAGVEVGVADWMARSATAVTAGWQRGFLLGPGAPTELADVLLELAADCLDVRLLVLGGGAGEPAKNAADASTAHYLVTVRADAEPPSGPDRLARLLEPWLTGGSLVAHHGIPDDHWPLDLCWSPDTAARLAALRRSHDPYGVFR